MGRGKRRVTCPTRGVDQPGHAELKRQRAGATGSNIHPTRTTLNGWLGGSLCIVSTKHARPAAFTVAIVSGDSPISQSAQPLFASHYDTPAVSSTQTESCP